MANAIQVTTGTLTSKAAELKSLNSRFQAQVTQLRTQEGSLNSMWEGEARTAFHNAFEKDVTQMDNFYNLIEKYVQSLNEIAKEYDRAEKVNVSTATNRSYK